MAEQTLTLADVAALASQEGHRQATAGQALDSDSDAVLDAAMAALDSTDAAEADGRADGAAAVRRAEEANGSAYASQLSGAAVSAMAEAARHVRGYAGSGQLDNASAYLTAFRRAAKAVQADYIAAEAERAAEQSGS